MEILIFVWVQKLGISFVFFWNFIAALSIYFPSPKKTDISFKELPYFQLLCNCCAIVTKHSWVSWIISSYVQCLEALGLKGQTRNTNVGQTSSLVSSVRYPKIENSQIFESGSIKAWAKTLRFYWCWLTSFTYWGQSQNVLLKYVFNLYIQNITINIQLTLLSQ